MWVAVRIGLVWLVLVVSGGCATRGVAHVAPDESRPHFSWELRAGRDEGDEDLVCSSARRAQACTLPASADQRRSLATIHLAVHAAAQPTSYLGVMRIPFFEGSEGRNLGEVNAMIPPAGKAVVATVIGRVTSQPGTYTVVISVDATQPGTPTPERLLEEVQVTVRPAESGN